MTPRAVIEDSYRVEGRAELVDGRIIRFPPEGALARRIKLMLASSLHNSIERTAFGEALVSPLAYAIRPPISNRRESFSPHVAQFTEPEPANPWHFPEGAPVFAAEICQWNDDECPDEASRAAKRADSFEAGTRVVRDVDRRARTTTTYRRGESLVVFRRGDTADAEPAVPGWRLNLDELFAEIAP